MTTKTTWLLLICICCCNSIFAQKAAVKKMPAQRFNSAIKIDGELNEETWKVAPVADKFVELRPVPFRAESAENASVIYMIYNNEGIYVGGYMHEKNRDSIASELVGRDNFGNNDFLGVVFDTYQDKQNGFEYFVTPLGEQFDAKTTPNNEDFSWNAVWQSASKIQADGWTFEMFLPYSAIRFGKKKKQDWGLNFVRRRQKSGQQLFWQPLDPNINGFLTQEGTYEGLEDIKPPIRLQFSPYFSTYVNHDGTAEAGTKKTSATVNGGMDVKYGINQAFTLDMTLIPDFGQVQTDNRILNLSPFEQKFNENRSFFTEGTELFNKGNLFYSRRIGIDPVYKQYYEPGSGETITKDPGQAKIINATKISGRTQKGLGIGVLNAVTQAQYTSFQKTNGETYKLESMPLTNYNVFVLDQTLKHNSSVSLVNTNVWRSGSAYDANVTSGLFDLYDKKNIWNLGGNFSFSNIINGKKDISTGYAHSIYFGKTSGRLLFSVYQDLYNAKYDKSDMGYFTNNNYMEEGMWTGYRWRTPKKWYNQMGLNVNFWYNTLVTPIDIFKRKHLMYQNIGWNINGNAQTKKLWWFGFNLYRNERNNDYYEPRSYGRVFRNKAGMGLNLWFESNTAKKFSWTTYINPSGGGVFKRRTFDAGATAKVRFNSKFSVDFSTSITESKNQAGWAATLHAPDYSALTDTIIFSRRDLSVVENVLSVKYNFTNRMGLSFRTRHYWSKVNPQQFYQLDLDGNMQTPDNPFTGNVNQNYNFFSVDMVYNWQFAQGSFFSIVWKDIGEDFNRSFERNYVKNFDKTITGKQFNSLSVRVIYFLDYLDIKKRKPKTI
ncbi:DUF5916 domain-containing protein [Ferruginibacter sp. HRS2-29]|uniref:DUF5916 domain-containing protein n=1 Tax=Ferruginibacter sp. HRS2-29 TaxID=2487334 RepID=UPI0020CCAAB5|nr:DUF5916 domain-containing protein [Ferruginibacter sp. HRS2-29]MCP9750128.1 hypothetical protein [Ferruginibacter sp. HRS2-29]